MSGLATTTITDDEISVEFPAQIIYCGTFAAIPESQSYGNDGPPHLYSSPE
jgi:hypothetical protein